MEYLQATKEDQILDVIKNDRKRVGVVALLQGLQRKDEAVIFLTSMLAYNWASILGNSKVLIIFQYSFLIMDLSESHSQQFF